MHDLDTIHQNLSLDWENIVCPREESNDGAIDIALRARLLAPKPDKLMPPFPGRNMNSSLLYEDTYYIYPIVFVTILLGQGTIQPNYKYSISIQSGCI